MSTAHLIQAQLGGALIMLGARNLLAIPNGLQFSIRGSRQGNKIVIKLAADDTYTVELWNIARADCQLIGRREGVYVDALKRTIKALTGLDTSL